MGWIEDLMNKHTALGIIRDIKKQFKNKEIHELMDYYIKPALDNKEMYLENVGLRHFSLVSKIDSTTINLKIDTFIDDITDISIYIFLPNSDLGNLEDYTIEYKVKVDKDEGKITIWDNEIKIMKTKNHRIIEFAKGSKVQTYIDNNLRYSLIDLGTTDLLDSSLSSYTTTETYIDLDRKAVCRKIEYDIRFKAEHPLTVKYLESNQYYTPPFENLYGVNYSENNNKMEESSESSYNEFINGGNNRILYK